MYCFHVSKEAVFWYCSKLWTRVYKFSHNLVLCFFLLRLLYFCFYFLFACVPGYVCMCVLLTLLRVSEDLGLGLLLSSGMAYKLGIAFLVDVS